MAGMIEVAKATVTIIPNMQGAQQTITSELTGTSAVAGTKAGQTAGKSMVSSMGQTMGKAGASLTKSVTLPLVAVGAASVAAWKEVDSGLDTIIEKTGASGDALEDMHEILNNITGTIPTDFATAGDAIGEVNTRFGLTGANLEKLSTQFVKFAKINNQDVSSSVDNVSKVVASFGLSASDAGNVLDALNKVGQQTGVDVGSLAQTMSANAASFREMGLSAESAASFLGTASLAGLESSQMVMGLRTALKKASSEGKTLDTVLGDFTKVMKSNASESDKLSMAYELFGSRAGAAIYNAVKNGKIDLENFTASLGNFQGSVDSTFEGTLDPMDKFTVVLNQLKSAGAELITAVGPSLASVLGSISGVLKSIADVWQGLSPGMQDLIVKFGLIAMAAGPVLSAGGKLLGGVQKLGGFMSGLGEKFSGLTSGLTTFGNSASSAASGASNAATSFGTMAGQALLLVSAGVAVLAIASAMAILVQSAIALADAGPGAVAVFVLLAGVAVGVTAGIVAIGSAATVSAVGLLAMGAAVLMVSAGIALIVVSMALFCQQLPIVATYGGDSALALAQIAGSMGLMALGAVAVTATLVPLLATFGLFVLEIAGADLALIGLLAELAIVDLELLVMDKAVSRVNSSMLSIASAAKSAANDLTYMVGAIDVVGQLLGGLKDKADAVISFIANAFKSKSENILTVARASMASINTAMTSGTNTISSNWDRAFTKLSTIAKAKMELAKSSIQKEINAIKDLFSKTEFKFNSKIAVPHFSMNGSFSAQSGSVPNVSVSWYKEAATKGAVFSSPTVIGVGDARQPEMLIGERTLYQKISEATESQGDIIVPVYIGNELLDTVVAKANKRNTYKSGGR